jgi:DNA-binding response OmpR family regulator
VVKVLLIEDEAAIRLLVRVNLAAEGIELLESREGATGIELARAERPDLILLDVGLPVLDGWQVGRELKEDAATHEIPLVFLTALAHPGERERGFRLGAVDYITKPFDPGALARRVLELITSDDAEAAHGADASLREVPAGSGAPVTSDASESPGAPRVE